MDLSDLSKVSAGQPDPTAASAAVLRSGMLDAMEEALGIAFIVYDGNDHIAHASRQVRQYFPIAPHFLTPGTRLRDFLGAVYDRKGDTQSATATLESAGREEWIAESIAAHWRERSDAQERDPLGRWLRISKRRFPSGYGLCMVSDITEQKKREEQWRADIERVQLTEEILDNLPYPVLVHDRTMTIVAVNKSFCALWKANYETVLGSSVASVFEGALADRLEAACRRTLDTGAPSDLDEQIVLADGGWGHVTIRTRRVGKPGRYFVVSGFEGEFGSVEKRDLAGDTVSRDEVGRRREKIASVEISPTVLAGRKVVTITADADFDAACMKVLTAMGAETCSVRSAREAEALFEVATSVSVVVDFAIVDTQMDLRCLELAECHARAVLALDHFQIDLELAPRLLGQPAEGRPKARSTDDWEISVYDKPRTPEKVRYPEVLVAEDNPVNQIVFSQILEALGYGYRIVDNGPEVVRLWEELRPAVILMDLTLPGLNGIEAAREIRHRDQSLGYRTPIVGVLVQAFDNSAEDCVAAGMNEVIVKPVSPDMVEAVFRRLAPSLLANRST